MLSQILQFVKAYDLFVFPLASGRKKPEITEWERKSSNAPEQIQKWATVFPGCNWGVAAGPSHLIILDSDNKKGIDGNAEAAKTGNPIPKTLTVKTPTGGYHRYYRGEGRNRVRFIPGNDIRSQGGYVVAPFSSIGDASYEIIDSSPIVDTPQWIRDAAGTPRPKQPDAPLVEYDLPENVSRADDFLRNAPPAVEGNGGDEQTFRVAAKLRDLGISDSVANDMMLSLWNPRCRPPWSSEELWQKISNAYRYAKDRPGNDTEAGRTQLLSEIFGSVKIEEKTRHIRDLGLRFPERNWLVKDWIPAGGSCATLLTGDGGTGKSQLALQLAMSLAYGVTWLGMETTQCPVLYVSCEDDDDELDRRVFHIRKNTFFSTNDAPLWVMPRVGKSSTLAIGDRGRVSFGPFYAELDEVLGQLPEGPKALFLDTAADMFAGNENDRGEVTGFSKVILSRLGLKHHATIILISHPPKANAKGESATFSGSTAWNNAVRARLFLRYQEKKKNAYRVLSVEKNNYAESGKEITLQYSQGIYIPVEEVEVFSVIDSAVLEAIQGAESIGQRLSLRKQSLRYIGLAIIHDTQGKTFSEKAIVESAKRLARNGRVTEITGQRENSGLSVLEKETDIFS